MSKYVLLYQGGAVPQSPEEGEKVMTAWRAWFAAGGDAILDPGNAFGAVLPPSTVNGYSIVEAGSAGDLASMLGDHPHVAAGGRIEIQETVDM